MKTSIISEIARSLPNGFHDAELLNICIDYANQTAALSLNLDVSNSEDESEELSRPARLVFSGVQFVVIDPPEGECDDAVSMIEMGDGQPQTAIRVLPPLRAEASLCWLYMSGINNFIRIAAQGATLEWT
jgi:hypothetical protein